MKANPQATFPVPISAEKPAFLFPVNVSHVGSGGDANVMGAAVTGGVVSAFGTDVVSGQQLLDVVGNLSFDLAEQIRSQAESNAWEMSGGASKTADDLSNTMTEVLSRLQSAGVIGKQSGFKYVIALHSHGSSTMGGTVLAVESWGGIYDMESRQIVSYISTTDNLANKPEVVTATLPNTYNEIVKKLIAGKAN